jgi:hypothetical protein
MRAFVITGPRQADVARPAASSGQAVVDTRTMVLKDVTGAPLPALREVPEQ